MVVSVKKVLNSRVFWQKTLVSVAIFLWLGFLFVLFSRNVFNIHFGDEDDNFLLGKFLTRGSFLYSDLFSHHQPLGYVISAFVQTVTKPETIFQLVGAHRAFIFAWAAIWTVVAGLYFGNQILVFTIVYEVAKRAIFGDQFLSESLAVYPIVFISSFLLTKKEVTKITAFLIGLAFSTAGVLLLPTWPMLGFLFISFAISQRSDLRRIVPYIVLGVVFPILVTLKFINIGEYFHNSFYINNAYYLKYGVNSSEGIRLMAFITPAVAILKESAGNNFLQLIKIFSGLWFVVLVWLFSKKYIFKAAFIILLLGLANIRYVEPGKMFFQGFHSIPWFAFLVLSVVWGIFQIRKLTSFKQSLNTLLVIMVILSIWLMGQLSFERGNKIYAYEVSHARTINMANILGKISLPNDTLFVVPGDWLLYWSTNIKPASSMLNYYGWMKNVPEIKERIDTLMTKNPPTFFYCIDDCLAIGLDRYLEKYQEIKQQGMGTRLFVLKTNITRNLRDKLAKNELSIME